jgi:hypothetical protein
VNAVDTVFGKERAGKLPFGFMFEYCHVHVLMSCLSQFES